MCLIRHILAHANNMENISFKKNPQYADKLDLRIEKSRLFDRRNSVNNVSLLCKWDTYNYILMWCLGVYIYDEIY